MAFKEEETASAISALLSGPLGCQGGESEVEREQLAALCAGIRKRLREISSLSAAQLPVLTEVDAALRERLGDGWRAHRRNDSTSYQFKGGKMRSHRPDRLTDASLGLALSENDIIERRKGRAKRYCATGDLATWRANVQSLLQQNNDDATKNMMTLSLEPVVRAVESLKESVTISDRHHPAVDSFAKAVLGTISRVNALTRDPDFMAVEGPVPHVRDEISQLKALLKVASSSSSSSSFLTSRPSSTRRDNNATFSGGGQIPYGGDIDVVEDGSVAGIIRLCREIIESSAGKKPPLRLKTRKQRMTSIKDARRRLEHLRNEIIEIESDRCYVTDSKTNAEPLVPVDDYDLQALTADLASLAEIKAGLSHQHKARSARLKERKKKAHLFVEGHGEREAIIMNVLRFAVLFARRNQESFEAANRAVLSAKAEEAVLEEHFNDDSRVIRRLQDMLSKEAHEARLIQDAKTALLEWRKEVFEGMDKSLQRSGGHEAEAQEKLEYVYALQQQTHVLQQLRSEAVRLAGELRSEKEPLKRQLLEVETRLALGDWIHCQDGDGFEDALQLAQASRPAIPPSIAGEAKRLQSLRATLREALSDQSACLDDLTHVVDDMDARLAQKLWHGLSSSQKDIPD